MSSPKLLRKISCKGRPLKVLVLGQPAVGKTALTVRFITHRFIGDYDPTLEKRYRCQKDIDGENIGFEIYDTAGHMGDEDDQLNDKLRWADCFILVYSVTDRCSFDECTRLRFLISHVTSKHSSAGSRLSSDSAPARHTQVALVGNKNDLEAERMVPITEGRERSRHLGCSAFYDISVRESCEQAKQVFVELYKNMKRHCQNQGHNGRKQLLRHQNAITDSPPSPRARLQCRSLSDDPPSPRSRESRVPVLGLSKDELLLDSLAVPDPSSDGSNGSHGVRRSLSRRKKSVSKRIISKVIPSFSSSSKETDSFHSDSDLNTNSS